jgi:hypothetical protein
MHVQDEAVSQEEINGDIVGRPVEALRLSSGHSIRRSVKVINVPL